MKQRKKNDLNSTVTTTPAEEKGITTNKTIAIDKKTMEIKGETKTTATSIATIKYKSHKKFETENM